MNDEEREGKWTKIVVGWSGDRKETATIERVATTNQQTVQPHIKSLNTRTLDTFDQSELKGSRLYVHSEVS